MVHPGWAHTPQRFVHHQDTHDTREAVRLRDVRLHGSHTIWTGRSNHYRSSRRPNYLVLAEEDYRRLSRVLFNMAAPAIAISIATHIFFLRADVAPLYKEPQPILSLVVPLLILATLYFLLNSLLIAGAVGFEKRSSHLKSGGRIFCGCR